MGLLDGYQCNRIWERESNLEITDQSDAFSFLKIELRPYVPEESTKEWTNVRVKMK